MAKVKNISEMQLRILSGFDRELRNSGVRTTGLMVNAPVNQWKSNEGTSSTSSRGLSHFDKRAAALRAEIAKMDERGF